VVSGVNLTEFVQNKDRGQVHPPPTVECSGSIIAGCPCTDYVRRLVNAELLCACQHTYFTVYSLQVARHCVLCIIFTSPFFVCFFCIHFHFCKSYAFKA
jgi:hypothetical protein